MARLRAEQSRAVTRAVAAIHRRPYWLVVGWVLFGGRGGASSQPLFVICACNHDLTGRRDGVCDGVRGWWWAMGVRWMGWHGKWW